MPRPHASFRDKSSFCSRTIDLAMARLGDLCSVRLSHKAYVDVIVAAASLTGRCLEKQSINLVDMLRTWLIPTGPAQFKVARRTNKWEPPPWAVQSTMFA